MTSKLSMSARSSLFLVCAAGIYLAGCVAHQSIITETAGPLPGQIISDPDNPFWLVRYDPAGNHKPVFLCGPGDPEGLLFEDSSESAKEILRLLKKYGGNTMYVIAVRSHGGDGKETENPFIDHDPMKGVDDAILNKWDKILRPFDKAGIAIHFFLYDDSSIPFGKGHDEVCPAEAVFVKAMASRFKNYKNLIWNISEEYRECMTPTHAENLAKLIAAEDSRNHVIGISQNPGRIFEHNESEYIKLWHMQSDCISASNAHEIAATVSKEAWGNYHATYSEIYKYGYHLMRDGDRKALRDLSWSIAMTGVYVMHGGIWLGNWQANPCVQILSDMGKVHTFMESVPDLTHHVSRDERRHGSTQYVMANEDISYIAYSLDASKPMGLDYLSSGIYTLRWFDCISGKDKTTRARHIDAGAQLWHKPKGFGEEVVLHVRKQSDM